MEESFPRGGAERVQQQVQETKAKETKKFRKRTNSKDFLFGKDDPSHFKKPRKSGDSDSQLVASSSLPMGGGAVLQPTQTATSKKPAFIESISFQKLAKGTKLLGIVREVAEEYAVVTLPSMLTGFIRQDAKSSISLDRVVSVGQFLPVVVVKATSESIKTKNSSKPQMKRRIELSVSPSLFNNGLSADMLHAGMDIRGKIRSVEDHGCIIDLNVSGLAGSSCFLKYENIKGEYKILSDDEDEDANEKVDNETFKLNKGRVYDFTVASLPVKSKKGSTSIIQVKLESAKARSKRVINPATHLASNHSIRTLCPGMLINVDVEHFARNGLCVTLLGNVYRGAIDSAHLGGYLPEEDFKNKAATSEMWWKNVFVGTNRRVSARLIAVDPATKIIRFSLLPHILAMERNPNDLPPVGTIINNARVVRLDAGVGALLALPSSEESMDVDDENESQLYEDPIFRAASKIKCAYVHISKAIDSDANRTPDVVFAKMFSVNTIVPKLRILSTSSWVDNVASCATADSIVSSPVLTHIDLQPGAIYRAVPVIANLEGGGVLVQLGGMGIKGLIPASHIFDQAGSGDSSYRNKVRMDKYKVGKKVNVRCLVVNAMEKKCVLTAKKSLLSTDVENPINDYATITPGTIATGFISSVTKGGIAVTFYNNVYGKISARKLAEEVGVADPTVDYKVGDVIKVRVQQCTKRARRNDVDDDSYVLGLSLDISGSSQVNEPNNSMNNIVSPGSIVPEKSMKIVELVPSREVEGREGFIPGHVFVSIKAKYVSSDESLKGSITCKLPFEQIFDTYDEEATESCQSFDGLVMKVLQVGKKIAQEAVVLATTNAKGFPVTPIVSLKPSLIETAKSNAKSMKKSSRQIILPAPQTALYMGAYVQGYCARIDNRYGAFIRFLDNLTAIVPKLKGGLDIALYDTVLCKIVAMDVTNGKAPKILLKRVTSTRREVKSSGPVNTLVEKVKPGDLLGDVKVDSVNFARAAVTLLDKKFSGCAVKARVHVTMAETVDGSPQNMPILVDSDEDVPNHPQDKDKITNYHPFHSWEVGSIVKDAHCVAIDVRDGITYIEVSNRTTEKDTEEHPIFVEDPSNLKIGTTVSAIITAVSKQNKGIWVQVSPGCTGFISGVVVSSDEDVLNNMNKYFMIGGRIKCTVLPNQRKEGAYKQVVQLSALGDTTKPKPARGDIIVGRVNRNIKQTRAPALMLEFPGGRIGRCDITELEEVDDWENMPLGRAKSDGDKVEDDEDDHDGQRDQRTEGEYRHGLFVQCRVLSAGGSGPCEVSLRESRLDGDLDIDESPEEKEIVHAFVVNTNKKGCFLRLSRNIEGRVILKELSDSFLPDPASMFPAGRLVVGKVKKVNSSKDSTKKSRKNKIMIDLDLRESVLLEDQNKLCFDDIKEGEKHGGVVTRIESYGVFVRLENSEVSGLVHLSECSDDYIKSLSALYDPGDLVKVLVIKADKEEKRIGLSMKASHFEGDETDDDSESDDDSDEEMVDSSAKLVENSDDSDDENYVSKLASKMQEMEKENDSESEDDSDSASSSDDDSSTSDEDEGPQTMDTDVGFNWGTQDDVPVPDDDSDSSSDESDSGNDSDDAKKGHRSRKKATAKKQEEKEIAKMEQRLADGTADENPETTADFERLLASDPNSSENWIKFMAYHLSLADIESARAIANRGFEKIEFRQEGEKLNVWTALITLESKYGTPKSFTETIERASQHNNPKQVYLRVCEMLEKDVANSHGDASVISRADDMFSKMCKKFRSKKTVWIAHFRYLLKSGRHDEAHQLWKRSVKSLPDYKHVETMSKFAQLEYEHGSAPRARTIFDALLDKNSKRMDLLFVYVDKEIKHGEVEVARRLFERTMTPPSGKKKFKFNDKQMKSLFKKWYRMEDEHGDEDSTMRVKLAAKEYVERSSK